ncbi:hypothetical protein BH11PSE10_BH11PSE10_20800 [soil metagenome]
MPMPRAWVWIQLIIGWLPVWVLFTVLLMTAHGSRVGEAAPVALRLMVTAAVLGLGVQRLSARLPWPHPWRLGFLLRHSLAACVYSVSWLLLNSLVESALQGRLVLVMGPGLGAYLVTGIWFYVMIAGITYANHAAERTAQLSAQAARSQLAALRTQLHPHFLFNALHTVVQLIPIDPRGAVRAAELLAGVLRRAVEEQRDLLPLREEWSFVQRYLEIEQIRFGERLRVESAIDDAALGCTLPSFALQTLVENAVRHGAAPSVEPTTLRIEAGVEGAWLRITVSDDGSGADPARLEQGTGLPRLRERLAGLYGGSARLQLDCAGGRRGFGACLRVPLQGEADD